MCIDDLRRHSLLGRQSIRPGKATCVTKLFQLHANSFLLQLGDGSVSSRNAPPALDALTGAHAIATGLFHTCTITTSCTCWGLNSESQLGDGTSTNRLSPPPPIVFANGEILFPTTSTTPSATQTPSPPPKGLNIGVVAGSTAACTIGIVMFVLAVQCYRRRRCRRSGAKRVAAEDTLAIVDNEANIGEEPVQPVIPGVPLQLEPDEVHSAESGKAFQASVVTEEWSSERVQAALVEAGVSTAELQQLFSCGIFTEDEIRAGLVQAGLRPMLVFTVLQRLQPLPAATQQPHQLSSI
jgi:hypothetical protein